MQNTSRKCEFFNADTDKITALLQKRCYIDNKEYVKGQKMFSGKNGCYACICDDGFDNTTLSMSTHCQRVKCNIDILYTDRVMAGCIPIYYGKAMCCPIGWKCRKRNNSIICQFYLYWLFWFPICFDLVCDITAERQDEIIASNQVAPNLPNMTCTFGSLVLQIGDKISSEKYCVECSCKIPPMAHCVQIGYCWTFLWYKQKINRNEMTKPFYYLKFFICNSFDHYTNKLYK